MKWQVEGQQWRLRVDEAELQHLLAGEAVTLASQAPGFAYALELVLHPGAEAAVSGDAAAWRVALPSADVRALAARLPSKDGIRFGVTTPAGDLELRFDVDVRDSARRLRAERVTQV